VYTGHDVSLSKREAAIFEQELDSQHTGNLKCKEILLLILICVAEPHYFDAIPASGRDI
jgi:hypothetical protein